MQAHPRSARLPLPTAPPSRPQPGLLRYVFCGILVCCIHSILPFQYLISISILKLPHIRVVADVCLRDLQKMGTPDFVSGWLLQMIDTHAQD